MKITLSIIVLLDDRCRNLEQLLERLLDFSNSIESEIILIDSSQNSQHVQREIKNRKVRYFQIKPNTFNHGGTRNYAARIAKGEYVCFVSQDVLPKDSPIFCNMLEDFTLHSQVVAVYVKQIPHTRSLFMEKIDLHCLFSRLDSFTNKDNIAIFDPSLCRINPPHKDMFYWYAIFNSCATYKRKYVLNNPFPEVRFGEDLYLGKHIFDSNYIKVYDARSEVIHSHDPLLSLWIKRQYYDFQNKVSIGIPIPSRLSCKIQTIYRKKCGIIKKFQLLVIIAFFYLLKSLILLISKIRLS